MKWHSLTLSGALAMGICVLWGWSRPQMGKTQESFAPTSIPLPTSPPLTGAAPAGKPAPKRDFSEAEMRVLLAPNRVEETWTGLVTKIVRVNKPAKPMDDSAVHWDVFLRDPNATPTPLPTATPTPVPTATPLPTSTPDPKKSARLKPGGIGTYINNPYAPYVGQWGTLPPHLRATAQWTPVPLPTPTPTPIPTLFDLPALVTPMTLIVTQDGRWRDIGSIRVGQKITVVAPPPQYWQYRSWSRVLILPNDAPEVPLTNISPPATRRAFWESRKGNVRVRVTSAGWFSPPRIYRGDPKEAPIFTVSGEILGPMPRQTLGFGARMPLERALEGVKFTPAPQAYALNVSAQNQKFRITLAPMSARSPDTKLSFSVLDPLAPKGADGSTQNVLWFPNLPNQRGYHYPGTVRTLASGTKVKLRQVLVGQKNCGFVFEMQRAPQSADAEFDFGLGRYAPDEGASLGIFVFAGRYDGRTYETGAEGVPPAKARTFGLEVTVTEKRAAKAQARWLHHFEIPLSPRKLAAQRFGPSPSPDFESFFP